MGTSPNFGEEWSEGFRKFGRTTSFHLNKTGNACECEFSRSHSNLRYIVE